MDLLTIARQNAERLGIDPETIVDVASVTPEQLKSWYTERRNMSDGFLKRAQAAKTVEMEHFYLAIADERSSEASEIYTAFVHRFGVEEWNRTSDADNRQR